MWSVLYGLALGALLILAYVVAHFIPWDTTTELYALLIGIYRQLPVLVVIALVLGVVVIFFVFWFRTLGYLENIVDATAVIAGGNENDRISLPEELSDLETRLNTIHLESTRNARQAREAEQRKNDLIVYLAHDLKTPLTSVIGYLTLLKDEEKISPELQKKYLSIAKDKADRLEDLINEFFEITRFNLSRLTLDRTDVNLTMMLEQIIFEFGPMLGEKSLRCRITAPKNVMVLMDADKMQRVFDNLLRNAIIYSHENTEITTELTKDDDSIYVTVTNKGSALPQDKLHRVFEQFYRLDSARSSKQGGAGLGLAIAKEIVELHEGSIAVTSEDGVTSFCVRLPRTLTVGKS